ncbi:MAG: FAD:protein FMN transferase [Rhizobiales bacterium]|nr:FAD:protein FMN transferase [Hyphomicrobiales bacterium]
MGTRWSALLYRAEGFDPAPIRHALQIAVDEVDAQMSMWKPDSDLMRLNACPVGEWITVPERLMDDAEAFRAWALEAVAVAHRAGSARGPAKKTSPRKRKPPQ